MPIQTIDLSILPDRWNKAQKQMEQEFRATASDLHIDLAQYSDPDYRQKQIDNKTFVSLEPLRYNINVRYEHNAFENWKKRVTDPERNNKFWQLSDLINMRAVREDYNPAPELGPLGRERIYPLFAVYQMHRIKTTPSDAGATSQEYLLIHGQLIGLKNSLTEKGVLEPHSVDYGTHDECKFDSKWVPIDPRDEFSRYRKIPQPTAFVPVYDLPFTAQNCDFYFDYRISDSISLSIMKQGSAGVYGVSTYKEFRDEDFETLYENCRTPSQKTILVMDTAKNEKEIDNRILQQHLEEVSKRKVI
jgi:hypothetical protein